MVTTLPIGGPFLTVTINLQRCFGGSSFTGMTGLAPSLIHRLERGLSSSEAADASAAGSPSVTGVHPLSGGDVARSFRIDLSDGQTVFAKTHDDPPPGFFTTEAAGLSWLGDGLGPEAEISLPAVLVADDDPPLLVLAWIDESPGGAVDDPAFGRGLAAIHQAGAEQFGRLDGRTTGSRAMPNEPAATWSEFYAERRLRYLGRLAADVGALSSSTIAAIDDVANRLDDLVGPPEAPARLHGDLWAGNRLVDRQGRSWLIDPAAFGGHREFDLAMMLLFGGFGPAAFASYHEVYPLADGWEERVPLHQLSPLIVHAIKFGGGYRQAVDDALARYR